MITYVSYTNIILMYIAHHNKCVESPDKVARLRHSVERLEKKEYKPTYKNE
jgi:hypothetical protein